MSQLLFSDDSDTETRIKTDNEYAKSYNKWRKKEELNKLKTKYGEVYSDDDDESSSSDDEDAVELTGAFEKQFFKTLACLKNKDPVIYDKNVEFFETGSERKDDRRKSKESPLYLKDYERKLLLEKGGKLSESEDEEQPPRSPTYIEEQEKLRRDLQSKVEEDDEETEWDGGLLTLRQKSEEEKKMEEEDYLQWLAGQKEEIDDKDMKSALKSLKQYWSKPDLDEDEKFLRDYVLKKKFLDNEDADYIPTYDEIVHDSDDGFSEDEKAIEKQEEFENKYNFRFEEPDDEFIKRYPRTIENSLRKTDDKRKLKRQEVKERKEKEKKQKMEELKKLQELKRKEIEEKIEKLKEITGNEDINFTEEDIEGDFDPEAHDKRMKALFSDEFYEGPEEEQKPKFPELDEELEIENYENWENETATANEPETDNLIMDCDYDPSQKSESELIESTRHKKRKRKSKFAKALSQKKPIFDPNEKTFEEYFDEYYKLDCEDIIADIPCRFKYRNVVPNSFGLSVSEILGAKDRELNKWCSLKKAVQIRPEHVEKYDQTVYERKGQNEVLKRKILPSLFSTEADELPENVGEQSEVPKVSKKSKKNQQIAIEVIQNEKPSKNSRDDKSFKIETVETEKAIKKKNRKRKANEDEETGKKRRKLQAERPEKKFQKFNEDKDASQSNVDKIGDSRLSAYGINPKKFRNKLKYGNKNK